MEIKPDNKRRILFTRIVASIVVFTVFVLMAVAWVMTQDSTLKWAIFIPLVTSILMLPREITGDDMGEETRIRTKLWLSYVRLAYFVIALLVMLGLPELLY